MKKKLLLVTACLIFGYAHADGFGRSGHGRADAPPHTGCWVPGGTPGWPLFQHLRYLRGFISVPGLKRCTRGTDMFLDNRLSNRHYFGVRTCRSNVVNGICDESSIRINKQLINSFADRRGTARNSVQLFNWCHEIGHSFGLNHSSVSSSGYNCMRTGFRSDSKYLNHHRVHVKNDL